MPNESNKNLRNSNQTPSRASDLTVHCQRCGEEVLNSALEKTGHYIGCGKTFKDVEELFQPRREASDGIFFDDD